MEGDRIFPRRRRTRPGGGRTALRPFPPGESPVRSRRSRPANLHSGRPGGRSLSSGLRRRRSARGSASTTGTPRRLSAPSSFDSWKWLGSLPGGLCHAFVAPPMLRCRAARAFPRWCQLKWRDAARGTRARGDSTRNRRRPCSRQKTSFCPGLKINK